MDRRLVAEPKTRATIQRQHRERKASKAAADRKIAEAARMLIWQLRTSDSKHLEPLQKDLPTDDAMALEAIRAKVAVIDAVMGNPTGTDEGEPIVRRRGPKITRFDAQVTVQKP